MTLMIKPLMNESRRRLAVTCFAAFTLCLSATAVFAEHGRNFAGEFQGEGVLRPYL